MLAVFLSIALGVGGQCLVQVEALTPTAPPCGPPWTETELRLDAGCSVVYHDGTIVKLVRYWRAEADLVRDPSRAVFHFGGAEGDPPECLCPLWERYPAYVIWEHGNPCVKGVV